MVACDAASDLRRATEASGHGRRAARHRSGPELLRAGERRRRRRIDKAHPHSTADERRVIPRYGGDCTPAGSRRRPPHFKPCACVRLFLSELLPSDWTLAVLYVDTDALRGGPFANHADAVASLNGGFVAAAAEHGDVVEPSADAYYNASGFHLRRGWMMEPTPAFWPGFGPGAVDEPLGVVGGCPPLGRFRNCRGLWGPGLAQRAARGRGALPAGGGAAALRAELPDGLLSSRLSGRGAVRRGASFIARAAGRAPSGFDLRDAGVPGAVRVCAGGGPGRDREAARSDALAAYGALLSRRAALGAALRRGRGRRRDAARAAGSRHLPSCASFG